jgi:two-component system response regulator AtoC
MENKGKESDTSVLVVDDDKNMGVYLETALSLMGYRVDSVRSGMGALERLGEDTHYSVVLLDIMMPEMDGLETLRRIREVDNDLPVIMLSALGQTQTIVKAMQDGASDYINKPFEDEELQIAIENVVKTKKLVEEVESLKRQLADERGEHFVSASEKMADIKRLIDKIADTDVPVLIQGESGVGKEIVARRVYSNSARRHKPLVKVSCVALPGELLESELFGYEKGAFTSASVSRPGRFGLAHEATIFLDEIGDLAPPLQAKLLQVLQDGVFTRLGAKEDTRVDVRVLAATNTDLEVAVERGTFREDLYHRLSVINITVPALRTRKEDIPTLCDHFLEKYNRHYNRTFDSLSREFIDGCINYEWPGNVRELENVIRKTVVLGDEKPVLSELQGKNQKETKGTAPDQDSVSSTSKVDSLKDLTRRKVQEVEKDMILTTLERTRWNKKKAAEHLGLSYKTLLKKIKKLEI